MTSSFRVDDPSEMLSPSLVVDRGLVARNLKKMIEVARGAGRLRPHFKTHKMAAIVRLAAALGVVKHKCATIAEAESIAAAGGEDVLLAYPLVGPNVARLANLVRHFPGTTFRTLVDDADAARTLSDGLGGLGRSIPVLIDLDVGMGRTGISPGEGALALYELIDRLPHLVADGLSAYDGHIHDREPATRAVHARNGLEKALELRDRLISLGLSVPRLVLGGTPTFPVHAGLELPGVECSPGTCTLHDQSYLNQYPDLPFVAAAAVLTRVVSRPRPGRLCLDVGHKAVAADPVGARLTIPDLPDAAIVGQSEEHLVVDTPDSALYPPGTPFLAFPTHICPTSALHRRAYVVEDGKLVDEWEVSARDRVIRY